MATEAQKEWIKAATPARSPLKQLVGAFYLHNGFCLQVEANEVSMDVLKQMMINNRDVKSILIYEANEPGLMPRALERVETINYLKLKDLRNGS